MALLVNLKTLFLHLKAPQSVLLSAMYAAGHVCLAARGCGGRRPPARRWARGALTLVHAITC